MQFFVHNSIFALSIKSNNMVKNKLISARKLKGLNQKDMAELASLSQSQYQRREKGDIKISDEEWERFAKVLETNVEDIKEEDTIQQIFNIDNNSVGYNGNNNNFYSIPVHMESLLESQRKYIEKLEQEIETLKRNQEK
jgi:transcriptional regulator with XRE-family HTH domain